jgi:hypothetical protein
VVKLLALLVAIIAALTGGFVLHRDDPDNGRFHVEGTKIIDPSGDEFVPLGVNMLGPAAFFHEDGRTAGHAKVLRESWRVNTVRINMCLPEGCDYNDVRNDRNDDLDGIVDEYTGEGIVVMLALHQVKPGEWPNDDQLDRIDQFWHDTALRYAGNQRVWFNLLNEPGHDKPANPRWAEIHTRLLRTIREAGADNMVVIDGTVWGQESGDTDAPRVADEDSAILTFGPQVKGDDDAVAFSFHVYNGWGSQELDDDQRDARMADYIDRVHGKGLALLIGETGGDTDPCCEPSALGTQSVVRVAPSRGVGILMWHGQAVDEHKLVYAGHRESDPAQIDDLVAPTNLTWQGRLFWDLTHG